MKYLIPLFVGLMAFASCEKDIIVDIPPQPSRLVMNSVLRVGDPFVLTLTRTASIKESSSHAPIIVTNATVVLYIDGQIADTLKTVPGGEPNEYTSHFVAETGKSYRFVVEASGFESIEASAVAPAAVPVAGWEYKPDARQMPNSGTHDNLVLSWKDSFATKDYYVVRLTEWNHNSALDFYSWANCIYTTDPSVETATSSPLSEEECISANSIFLHDGLFNGVEKKLSLYAPAGMLQPFDDRMGSLHYAHFHLAHVSEEFYKFLKSYMAARDVNGNPFAEPINVLTNVQRGYGVFAIVNEHIEEIEI